MEVLSLPVLGIFEPILSAIERMNTRKRWAVMVNDGGSMWVIWGRQLEDARDEGKTALSEIVERERVHRPTLSELAANSVDMVAPMMTIAGHMAMLSAAQSRFAVLAASGRTAIVLSDSEERTGEARGTVRYICSNGHRYPWPDLKDGDTCRKCGARVSRRSP